MLRILRRVLAALLTIWIVWSNIAVHTAPRAGTEEELLDLRAQLRYLERSVHAGLGEEMQELFPEGGVFTHALYGLAWCGYAQRLQASDTVRVHALREARWALAQMESPDAQGRFPVAAEPKFGVFYCGWRNYLLGSIVALDPADSAEHALFERYSAELDSAFVASSSPYLESYAGMAWPADNAVAIASLALHDGATPQHTPTIRRWVEQVRTRLDERGLMTHAWEPYGDNQLEGGRGSSQALMNAFLPIIDEIFAREQFVLFREHFLMERFGVPLFREYPKGMRGMGDVDSGPVILGAGFAASIVGAAACRANGDVFHAQELYATIEGFGMVVGGERKRYIFGALPIADLFIAWSRSIPTTQTALPAPGFKRFHLWSLLAVLLLWAPWWIGVLRRRCWPPDQST